MCFEKCHVPRPKVFPYNCNLEYPLMFQQTIHGSARNHLGIQDFRFYLTRSTHILHSRYMQKVSTSLVWEGRAGCVGPCCAATCSYLYWVSLAKASRYPPTFTSAYLPHLQDLPHFPDLSYNCDLHLLSNPLSPPPLLQDHFILGTALLSHPQASHLPTKTVYVQKDTK